MKETVTTRGVGATREEALTDARKDAAEYFGEIDFHEEDIQAVIADQDITGVINLWEVKVTYHNVAWMKNLKDLLGEMGQH